MAASPQSHRHEIPQSQQPWTFCIANDTGWESLGQAGEEAVEQSWWIESPLDGKIEEIVSKHYVSRSADR